MKAKFTGADGAYCLDKDKIYRVNIQLGLFKLRQHILVQVCKQAPWDSGFEIPYDSVEMFLKDWVVLLPKDDCIPSEGSGI